MSNIIVSLLVLISISFSNPSSVFAATTPSLGDADSFGILSSTYTNTVGGTSITGDLGYTTGPATAPTVSGTTHVANATYTQAGIDQGSALTDLNGQACTFTFASGAIDLATDTTHGSIGVYTPGVYCTAAASAASIGTGGITLSGSGTYIFKINGAFTTVASSVVTLSGASACDVFWAPTSATTLGASSTLNGTVIDAAGITIGSTVTWSGRALAFGGTVSTTSDTITVPSCDPTPTPTPTVASTSSTTSSSSSTSSSTSAPSTPCPTLSPLIITPSIIEVRRISANSIFISWGPNSGTDFFNIRYGPSNGNWLYNTDVHGFSTTINNLPSNQSLLFQIAARNECLIGSYGGARSVGGTGGGSLNITNPGFPDTGGPGLPETGFSPFSHNLLYYIPLEIFA